MREDVVKGYTVTPDSTAAGIGTRDLLITGSAHITATLPLIAVKNSNAVKKVDTLLVFLLQAHVVLKLFQ